MLSDDLFDADKQALFEQIQVNYQDVINRVSNAAFRSGRKTNDVLLVAVSKYAEPNDGIVEGFLRAGVFNLAENRPQKFLAKAEFWSSSSYWNSQCPLDFVSANVRNAEAESLIKWHFIGKLQRNKVRRILPYVSLIHSVDSWKLLETIERILQEENEKACKCGNLCFPKKVSVLLEAHISDDETKQGFAFDELEAVVPKIAELKHVIPLGLMGMAGLTATPDETRRQFASLRKTFERIQDQYPELKCFRELSMGMSGDFEIAIEEGSTIVRIGSSLYPKRK